jgi:hypothetical protein
MNRARYQISSGVVTAVQGVDAAGYGLIQDIRYKVGWNTESGTFETTWLIPHNVRPSSRPTDSIRAARVGDPCCVHWYGDEYRIGVWEGLDDRERCNG